MSLKAKSKLDPPFVASAGVMILTFIQTNDIDNLDKLVDAVKFLAYQSSIMAGKLFRQIPCGREGANNIIEYESLNCFCAALYSEVGYVNTYDRRFVMDIELLEMPFQGSLPGYLVQFEITVDGPNISSQLYFDTLWPFETIERREALFLTLDSFYETFVLPTEIESEIPELKSLFRDYANSLQQHQIKKVLPKSEHSSVVKPIEHGLARNELEKAQIDAEATDNRLKGQKVLTVNGMKFEFDSKASNGKPSAPSAPGAPKKIEPVSLTSAVERPVAVQAKVIPKYFADILVIHLGIENTETSKENLVKAIQFLANGNTDVCASSFYSNYPQSTKAVKRTRQKYKDLMEYCAAISGLSGQKSERNGTATMALNFNQIPIQDGAEPICLSVETDGPLLNAEVSLNLELPTTFLDDHFNPVIMHFCKIGEFKSKYLDVTSNDKALIPYAKTLSTKLSTFLAQERR